MLHQDKLEQLTATQTTSILAPDAFVKALEMARKNYVDRLHKAGDFYLIKETELYQLNWLRTLKLTYKILRGASKVTALFKQRAKLAKTEPNIQVEIPIELEIEGFDREEDFQGRTLNKKIRTWLIIGSFALFVASFMQVFALHTLAILTAALILHEGGHLLAMKIFGYRDTSVLFIPFFGAVATARREDATLTQKFWILLAGPLPGLIMGLGLGIATRDGNYPLWVKEVSWILISLNLFNLLPVYPLDGGKMADLLIFSPFPYLGVLFKVLCAATLTLVGLNNPMLLFIAVAIALSIPNSFRAAKANQEIRKELRQNPPLDRDSLINSIFSKMKELGYGKLPFSKRYLLAKDLIYRHHESRAKWTTKLLLVIVYCASLFGGIIGTLEAITPNGAKTAYLLKDRHTMRERAREAKKQEIERATEALRLNPNDSDAYIKRGRARILLRDYQGALADYDQVVRLNPDNIQHRLTRARFRYILKDYQGAIADYDLIIKLDSKNVQVYLARGYTCEKLKDYKGALADANSAIDLNPNSPDAYAFRSRVRRSLGDEKGAIADEQKAETLYESIDY